jgi:hypothetical protein
MNCNPKMLGFIWAGSRKEEYIAAHVAGNYTKAAQLVQEFQHLALGLLYFQQQDAAVSLANRTQAQRYGLCADEFIDNENFPYVLLRVGFKFVSMFLIDRPRTRPTVV